MLGRLGMSVENTIRGYGRLTGEVFSHKPTGRDGNVTARNLERVIKDIMRAETGQEDERMLDTPSDGKGCKT